MAATAWFNSLNEDLADLKIILITESFVHDFYSNLIRNDIALLKLEKQIQFTDNIRAICLPKEKIFIPEAFTAGWLVYLFSLIFKLNIYL